MICILHNKSYSYVPSVHPILFNRLSQLQNDEFKVIDVAKFNIEEISQIIAQTKLLVFDQSILNALHLSASGLGNNLVYMYLPLLKKKSFYSKVLHMVLESDVPVLHWASLTDPHGILTVDLHKVSYSGIKIQDYLQRICGIIWGYNSQELVDINMIDTKYNEDWFAQSENPKESYTEISKYISYEIEIPHCISEKEIILPQNKSWDIEIPGIKYLTRKIVQDLLQNQKYSYPKKRQTFYIGKINGVIRKSAFIPSTLIFRNNYKSMRYFISRSRTTFVCGSGLRYFVRKFLEVPAFNSVMLAYPPVNMEDYGFVDNYNYVHTQPEEVTNKLEMVLEDVDFQNKILKNATETIYQLHTDKIRAQQLIKTLKLIQSGFISSAKFVKGKYCYLNGNNIIAND